MCDSEFGKSIEIDFIISICQMDQFIFGCTLNNVCMHIAHIAQLHTDNAVEWSRKESLHLNY